MTMQPETQPDLYVIDDITLHKAKKGDIGACFDAGDAYYDYYIDNDSTDKDILKTAEYWFMQGLNMGSSAGYYPLGLVSMEYARLLEHTPDMRRQHVKHLFDAEQYFIYALHRDEDMDACYQLGQLYYDHADIIELDMDTPTYRPIVNEDTAFLKVQRQKKLQQAEKYLLMALVNGTTEAEAATYTLAILYWQFATETPDKAQKSEWLELSQSHFDKILPIRNKKTTWTVCRLFLVTGEWRIAWKYFKRLLFKKIS